MNRKEAFKGKDFLFGNRSNATNWYVNFNAYQMTWLWEHKMVEWSKPMTQFHESPNSKYIEFTRRGVLWNEWYNFGAWEWISTHIFRKYDLKRFWQHLRIKMGHHYDWQDYEGIDNLDEI